MRDLAIIPGRSLTTLAQDGRCAQVVERHADVPDDVRQAYLASVPAGRMGTPGDIAHAVSFFASISHLDNLTA